MKYQVHGGIEMVYGYHASWNLEYLGTTRNESVGTEGGFSEKTTFYLRQKINEN